MDSNDAWTMRAAFARDPDWSLAELLRHIDETGSPFPLTVLTHGVMVRGLAVKVEEWADHLDDQMDTLLGGASAVIAQRQRGASIEDLLSGGPSAGDVEQRRAEWREKGWRHVVDVRREDEAETHRRLDAAGEGTAFEDFPEDLAHRVVRMDLPPSAVTIKDASLFAFGLGGGPVTLPFVRVNVMHIAAWWPGSLDWSPLLPDPDEPSA